MAEAPLGPGPGSFESQNYQDKVTAIDNMVTELDPKDGSGPTFVDARSTMNADQDGGPCANSDDYECGMKLYGNPTNEAADQAKLASLAEGNQQ